MVEAHGFGVLAHLKDIQDHAFEQFITSGREGMVASEWDVYNLTIDRLATGGPTLGMVALTIELDGDNAEPKLKTDDACRIYAHARAHNAVKG